MKRGVALGKLSKFVDGIVEGRDPSLAEHHGRTSIAARQFGRYLGMGRGEIGLLVVGLSLHDFGKLSIPDSILHKPARLSSAELSMIQQHPELGHRMIEPLGLDPAINEIVLHHHENYDGTGYPAGLKGDGIPYFARVARILDSFDALTQDRPYNRGVPPGDALRILEQDERMYDPMLLATFSQAIVDSQPRHRTQPIGPGAGLYNHRPRRSGALAAINPECRAKPIGPGAGLLQPPTP